MHGTDEMIDSAARSDRGRRGRWRGRGALGAIVAAAVLLSGCVLVSPSTGVNPAGEPITASGLGFGGSLPTGIYVAFGPDPATLPADWFTHPEYFQAAVFVWPNGTGTATNQKMTPEGTFSFKLTRANGSPITAVYTDGFGDLVDCTEVQCGVVTMKAHGSTDRTFDSFKPVTFASP
jgi:hypothetical protein